MPDVEVIVPWVGMCRYRARALRWVRDRYQGVYPLRLVQATLPWSKAKPVMAGVASSTADIIVVADADVWSEGIPQAVRAVEAGAPWAMPHRGVFRLARESTDDLLTDDRANWEAMECERPHYLGTEGGGIVVAKRETILDVPMDPRFVGWGQEDESWGMALRCLHGPVYRVKLPLVHLWHPAPERLTLRKGSDAGWALHRRYLQARYDPVAMRALLAEIK